jgi:hypothetical protein
MLATCAVFIIVAVPEEDASAAGVWSIPGMPCLQIAVASSGIYQT